MSFLLGVFLSGLVLMVLALWRMECNDRTLEERIGILTAMRDFALSRPDESPSPWFDLHADFCKVTYYQHLGELLWRRDPMKLYSQEIQDVVKEKKNELE